MNAPIKQQSLGSLVAEKLRQKIWDKQIAFGERLIENELSEQFSVSRNTIRDALKILEYEELVISKPRKGTYVAHFTNEDWREMLELRILIESHAFVQALDRLDDNHFNKLNQLIVEMEKYVENNDWSALFDLDLKFHQYVIHLCGNNRIIKIYDSLQIQIRTFLVDLETYYSSPQSFIDEQKDLLATLKTKDPKKVEEKLRVHIGYVEGKLLAEE